MLRVSEVYVSTQGEGQHAGKMTCFVRFAGCNMRCPGWPCDTQHAIDPAIWRIESVKQSVMNLFSDIKTECFKTGCKHVCLTGGEPFMQKYDALQFLVKILRDEGYTIEVFTNGSYEFPLWALSSIDFMMDWKLAGSGEAENHREVRQRNALHLKKTDGIKFVVVDKQDILEAVDVADYLEDACQAEIWIAPAWGRIEPDAVIDMMKVLKLPWRLNLQVHKYIWDPDERGV